MVQKGKEEDREGGFDISDGFDGFNEMANIKIKSKRKA